MAQVLVVEDDRDMQGMLAALLRGEGHEVLLAESGEAALSRLARTQPDLVVLDLVLPGVNGVEVCRRAQEFTYIPIIVVTGKDTEVDKIIGLEAGADDYLTKPYSHKLLVSKIRTAIRRVSHKEVSQSILRLGIAVDLDARTVSFKEKSIRLTRKEFDLLTTFLRKPERVLSIPYLLETVWGYDPARYNDPATVHSHVSSLRRKLGPAAAAWIISVPGLGYRFSSTL